MTPLLKCSLLKGIYCNTGASLVAEPVENLPATQEMGMCSLVGKIPWRRKWQPAAVRLPGESHAQRSPVGYGLWGQKESDRSEQRTDRHMPYNPAATMGSDVQCIPSELAV